MDILNLDLLANSYRIFEGVRVFRNQFLLSNDDIIAIFSCHVLKFGKKILFVDTLEESQGLFVAWKSEFLGNRFVRGSRWLLICLQLLCRRGCGNFRRGFPLEKKRALILYAHNFNFYGTFFLQRCFLLFWLCLNLLWWCFFNDNQTINFLFHLNNINFL